MIGYATTFVSDLDRARDVVQDTFIRLYDQEPGKVTDGLKSWLYTVCRNRALDLLRREKRLVSMDDDAWRETRSTAPDPSETLENNEKRNEVMRYLERLPENQREVIRLKFQADLTYKEISDVTGLTVSNVGFLLHTGLRRLRTLMEPQLSAIHQL